MRETSNATIVKAILTTIGANLDTGIGRSAENAKVSRYRLPNGCPLVLEHDRKTPNVWMLPEHEGGALRTLGRLREYEPSAGKHSNLASTPEFRDRKLMRIAISCTSSPDIERAFRIVAGA
jgi:hypothetical protein